MSHKRTFEESFVDGRKENNKAQSSWLGRFLSQRREATVPLPPEVTATDEIYLQQFCDQFKHRKVDNSTSSYTENNKNVSDVTNRAVAILPSVFTAEKVETVKTSDDYQDLAVAANRQLRIFNLPYNIDSATITKAGLNLGILFSKVTMEICKTTSLSTGAASVELAPGVKEEYAIQKLQGEDFGGRLIRVQTDHQWKRRGSGGRSDRYFLGDVIDLKCKNCGQVGHILKNCTERGSHPCHLCAGKDHEAVNCPNITCFRCGDFGHHSKNCSKARKYSKAVICNLCASCYHDFKECSEDHEKAKRRLEDSNIRCMRCNHLGHAVCKPVRKVVTDADNQSVIHCPNCGQKGHHVDFPTPHTYSDDNFNPCVAPKFDAYLRFPLLLKSLENNAYLTGHVVDKQLMYETLAHSVGGGDIVTKMFPSLRRIRTVVRTAVGMSVFAPPIEPILPFPALPQRRTGQVWDTLNTYRGGYSHGLNSVYPSNYNFENVGIPYVDESAVPQCEALGYKADTYRNLYNSNAPPQQHHHQHQQNQQQHPYQVAPPLYPHNQPNQPYNDHNRHQQEQEQYQHQPPPPQQSCPSYQWNEIDSHGRKPYVDDDAMLPQCEAMVNTTATSHSLHSNNEQHDDWWQQQQRYEQEKERQRQYEKLQQQQQQLHYEEQQGIQQQREQRQQLERQNELDQLQQRLHQQQEEQRLQQAEQQRLQSQLEQQRILQIEQQRAHQLEQQRMQQQGKKWREMEQEQIATTQRWQHQQQLQQQQQQQQNLQQDQHRQIPSNPATHTTNSYTHATGYQSNNNGFQYNDMHDRQMRLQQEQQQQQQPSQYSYSSSNWSTQSSNPSAVVFRGSNGNLMTLANGSCNSSISNAQTHSQSYSHSAEGKVLLPDTTTCSYGNDGQQQPAYRHSNSYQQQQ